MLKKRIIKILRKHFLSFYCFLGRLGALVPAGLFGLLPRPYGLLSTHGLAVHYSFRLFRYSFAALHMALPRWHSWLHNAGIEARR